jgi:hypothetical protein
MKPEPGLTKSRFRGQLAVVRPKDYPHNAL